VPIHFRCPHCEKLLAIGTAKGGTQIHCPLCDRVITVPPRTEINVPTTTVMPPDLTQSWWMDAPPVEPPKPGPPPEPPSPPPADAWWLTANAPPTPSETAVTAKPPPSVPPPLPESIVSAPAAEPPPDLVFEPPTKSPAPDTNKASAFLRSFTPLHIFLLVGAVVISLLVLSVLFVLLRGSEPATEPPTEKPANQDTSNEKPAPPKEDAVDKPASPGPSPSRQRRERTEEELSQEAAAFPEASLDRRGEHMESQRVRRLAMTAAREGKLLDAGPQWLAQRPDLAGLPIRGAKECTLEPATVEQLQAGALALRAQLFAAAEGGDKPPDARKLREALTANGEQGNKWLRSESVPALQQLLMAEDASIRQVLIELLARIDGPRASAMLARNALFDLNPEVRKSACAALAKRPREEYQAVLLEGFRYPWSAVADHTAEALIALNLRQTVPALVSLLDQPGPSAPYKKPGKEELYIREVVRINHPRNCLLCHAPSFQESDKLRGFVPPADQPLPPPFTREYYANRRPGQFVRADVTYLQQDFSVPLPVENPGKWPAVQRFDFLVRERPAANSEVQAARQADDKVPNAYQQAIFFALRELTGVDPGPAAEDRKRWAR
jgi:phage FluMu protein Com